MGNVRRENDWFSSAFVPISKSKSAKGEFAEDLWELETWPSQEETTVGTTCSGVSLPANPILEYPVPQSMIAGACI